MEQMEEALMNHEELDLWFSDIKKWSTYDSCESRKVCLEVFGVPPRGWCWKNFNKIASLWGRLITLGKSIARTDSFEYMELMIVTDVFKRIDHDIILTLGDEGYRLMIRELGPAVQMTHIDHGYLINPPLEEMDSDDEVLGFDDLMENLDAANGPAQSNTKFTDPSLRDQGRDAAQESPENQLVLNSNSKMEMEILVASTNQGSIHSGPRTKTVSFSQNGYTEEFLKTNQQLQSLEYE